MKSVSGIEDNISEEDRFNLSFIRSPRAGEGVLVGLPRRFCFGLAPTVRGKLRPLADGHPDGLLWTCGDRCFHLE